MICDVCSKAKATVHLTEIVNDQITKLNLCEACAKKKGTEMEQHFGIADLLQGLAEFGPATTEILPQRTKCPNCGMTYDDFKKIGRLGCGTCYRTFSGNLAPLLKRIHGSARHTGGSPATRTKSKEKGRPAEVKSPSKVEPKSKAAASRNLMDELKAKLKKAVQGEQYEQAAVLRDELRALENKSK